MVIWHKRFGVQNIGYIEKMEKQELVKDLKCSDDDFKYKARELGEVISIDIDVMPCESVDGYKYRLDAIDRGSSWLWTFGLKNRGESEKHTIYLINSCKSHVREIRVDGAKEFLTNNFKDLCYEYGI